MVPLGQMDQSSAMKCETPDTKGADFPRPSEESSDEKMAAEATVTRRRGRGSAVQRPPVVGSYVTKNFADGSGALIGKIVSAGRFLAAVYEDGRREELEHSEIRRMLLAPPLADDEELARRKRKLEEILSEGTTCTRSSRRKVDASSSARAPAAAQGKKGRRRCREEEPAGSRAVEAENDVDSSTDSSESIVAPPDNPPSAPAAALQALALPASSGNLGVPEESVGCLLSVYSFLRAFSVPLFLSPFGLPEFVGSLVCLTQNSLSDSVHLSLMRALWRHLEVLSSEGSQAASKCLRCLDWAMLDAFTWPVYVVAYLHVMGWMKGPGWKGLQYGRAEEEEYYSLPAARKLEALQMLCDAVLDYSELRAEVDAREEADEEGELAADDALPQQAGVSAKEVVHPRRCVSRRSTAVVDSAAIALEGSTAGSNNLPSGVPDEPGDHPQDGNSDECRICRMDGTLICCDGCPSAYHSRCIGLAKASLPEGIWYCPECAARQLAPTFDKVEMGPRGAEMFGIDPFGRAFMGACNFLLVLEASSSSNVESTFRYYDRSDGPAILKFLLSAEGYSTVYFDICQEIAKYWAIPIDQCLSQKGVTDTGALQMADLRVQTTCPLPAEPLKNADSQIKMENLANIIPGALDSGAAISNLDDDLTAGVVINETDSVNQMDYISETRKYLKSSAEEPDNDGVDLAMENQSPSRCADGSGIPKAEECSHEKSHQQIDQDSDLLSSRSFSQPTVLTGLVQQGSDKKSRVLKELGKSTNDTVASVREGDAESEVSPSGSRMCIVPWQEVSPNPVGGGNSMGEECKNSCVLVRTSFHPLAYCNQYMLGEFAASAAANLVALDAKEGGNKLAVDASSSSLARRRKFVSASIAMQLKAFTGSCSMRFIWTSVERKLLECPRERCGWCVSCKGATVNKKGCLLNLAMVHAVKAALIRGHVGMRPFPRNSNEKSQVSAIASHILNMEADLFGLLIGPLADPKYIKRWRMLVREASSVGALRPLLLELERNIRSVAVAADWFKLFEDWFGDRPARRVPATPIQKRGPGRPKKKSLPSGATPAPQTERLIEISWWRGGRISRIVFPRGMLTRSLAKKAAREGGLRCIRGINYSGNPRSQQLAWRVAVEMSRSPSQIALQVRRLDAHIRWKDLVLPDQMPSEISKGAESEASVFRNAVICGKDVTATRVRYALTFGDRKHLPSSVMKNVLEIGTDPDGKEKEKLWFAENNVPLYLIKAYEERARREGVIPVAAPRRYSPAEEVQQRQLKAFRRDIFSYILHREDNPIRCVCSSCPRDVILRQAARCSSCQGYCHVTCLHSSSAHQGLDLDNSPLCKQCHIVLCAAAAKNGEDAIDYKLYPACSPKIKAQAGDLRRIGDHRIHCNGGAALATCPPPPPFASPCAQAMAKHTVSPSPVSESGRRHGQGSLQVNHGLIWRRRRKGDDNGEEFRFHHVIRRGAYPSSTRPVCVLCLKEYSPSSTYIRCQKCPNWVHAEAVQLKDEQLPRLVGFKCGKCRRKGWPKCPYEDDPDLSRKKKRDSVAHLHPSQDDLLPQLQLQPWPQPQPQPQRQPHPQSQLQPWPQPQLQHLPDTVAAKEHGGEGTASQYPSSGPTLVGMDMEMDVGMMRAHAGVDVDVDVDMDMDMDMGMDIGMDMSMVMGLGADMDSEPPQTYFSFTELLSAPEDSFFDAQLEELLPSVGDGGWADASAENGTSCNSVRACQKCGSGEPLAELVCQTCGLAVHAACVPWAAPGGDSAGGPWKCVGCRDWE
ncbi:DDT domain-containing protein PTM-like [Wolffia australiana]